MAKYETNPTDPTPTEEHDEALNDVAPVEEPIEDNVDPRDLLIAGLIDERDQLKDQLLRSLADMKNVRRRHEEDRRSMALYATEDLVRDLLPVLDNFERTLQVISNGASPESVIEGIQMIERQLRGALQQRQIIRIESVGSQFDPAVHEALGHDEGTDQPPGTITAEIEAGYRIGDRVIRPARVRVAK